MTIKILKIAHAIDALVIYLKYYREMHNRGRCRRRDSEAVLEIDFFYTKYFTLSSLMPEQAQCLLQAAREHKLEALLAVAIVTGLRRGELLGLHWQDIDFDTRSLHVRRTVNRIGKFGLVESEPKTQRSRRKITLPAFVVDVLKRHQEQQEAMREKAGGLWRATGIVFCNIYGGYLEPSNLHDDFKRLLKSAQLPNIRFHDLRHSAATILFGMGVHPKIVQEILGHSNISMTMDTYSHVLPSMQEEAMNRLDDLFGKEERAK